MAGSTQLEEIPGADNITRDLRGGAKMERSVRGFTQTKSCLEQSKPVERIVALAEGHALLNCHGGVKS